MKYETLLKKFGLLLAECRLLTEAEQQCMDPSFDPEEAPKAVATDLATMVKHKVWLFCGDSEHNELNKLLKKFGNRRVHTFIGPNKNDMKLLAQCNLVIECTPTEAEQIEDITQGSLRYDDYTSGPLPPKGFCWFENE